MNADDVLNCLSLVVLLTTSLEKFVIAAEPVEDSLVAIPCTFEQWVLS